MRLENLYLNFGKASAEGQAAYISAYRLRRAEDMAKPSTRTKKGSVNTSKIDLSDAEKALMKMLGLKQKDMKALQALVETTEETTNDVDLFTDDTFEEEDEKS